MLEESRRNHGGGTAHPANLANSSAGQSFSSTSENSKKVLH
jgi:hypothetical protein